MNKITTHKQEQEILRNSVSYINSSKRAMDAVVFELTNGTPDCAVVRTVTLKTNCIDREFDVARSRRMARRLQALGFKQNWSALAHPKDGLRGTVRLWRSPLRK